MSSEFPGALIDLGTTPDSALRPPHCLVRVFAVSVQVHGISEIDAGQDGENVGLNEGNDDFQAVDGNREGERQPGDQKRQRKGRC